MMAKFRSQAQIELISILLSRLKYSSKVDLPYIKDGNDKYVMMKIFNKKAILAVIGLFFQETNQFIVEFLLLLIIRKYGRDARNGIHAIFITFSFIYKRIVARCHLQRWGF